MDNTVMLFDGADNYTEIRLEDSGIVLYVEDETGNASPTYTLEEAKQLMAALGRQIWIAENELGN